MRSGEWGRSLSNAHEITAASGIFQRELDPRLRFTFAILALFWLCIAGLVVLYGYIGRPKFDTTIYAALALVVLGIIFAGFSGLIQFRKIQVQSGQVNVGLEN